MLTVGSTYFEALQKPGEKFEDTVKRVVKALEGLNDLISDIDDWLSVHEASDPLSDAITR